MEHDLEEIKKLVTDFVNKYEVDSFNIEVIKFWNNRVVVIETR